MLCERSRHSPANAREVLTCREAALKNIDGEGTMLRNRILAILAMVSCSVGASWAQGGATGAISGAFQDASGAVIQNAEVSIESQATAEVVRQLTSDSSGLFTATLLPVGTYAVEVTAAGFPVTRFSGIIVRITETTRLTATMKVGTTVTKVEVQSQVENVNTTDATMGESLGSATITSLPLATRNFQQLLTLSAGASSDLNNASQLGRGAVYIHVNGGREDNNNYLIDGISVADYAFGELTYTPLPNPDSIQEFKVSTSLYDATQGRNGGGNINATLKSGSAKFHGDLWEYFRNTKERGPHAREDVQARRAAICAMPHGLLQFIQSSIVRHSGSDFGFHAEWRLCADHFNRGHAAADSVL